ncbi:MAG TPA: hypothetical protein VHW45_06410 [Candidatus Sulfotelmatobacter sp.]|nr:hypothetical protein [Candidatus Sulfotelmatobacter sp.]
MKSSSIVAPAVLAGVGMFLLFSRLGTPYLWQDEAATAVLAQRMLRFGRPLSYDGVNLITIDHFAAEDSSTIDRRTKDPQAAVQFYIHRGDYKPDTTWKWQPWGQFVIAALSLKILGATTFAARLPFALCGVLTILLLYWFVWKYLKSSQMALLACTFLVLNAYWIVHARQCRYYSLSSLFLVLTIATYAGWQWGDRWGALGFAVSAWCWFQVDYGTVWPVLGIVFADALIAQRHSLWRPVMVGGVLAAAIAPFAYYYELWGRLSIRAGTWHERFVRNVYNINEFILPIVLLALAIALLAYRAKNLPAPERRLVAIACAILLVFFFWVPSVAPAAFLRYSIIVAPLGCLLAAWVLVRLGNLLSPAVTWAGAAIFLLTPWWGLPLHLLRPSTLRHAAIIRPEFNLLTNAVLGREPDPNRPIIEWLKQNAAPDAEILIDYEDIPLMFYLPNPIRGGISAFRVEDDATRPPDFLVLRRSVDFVHWPVFNREIQRYNWSPIPIQAPDIVCGNCPDPVERYDAAHAPAIFFARRIREATLGEENDR